MILRDLALGLRLAVSGGSGPRLRAALTAVGVGIGVATLLIAASVPHLLDRHDERNAARSPDRIESPSRAPLLAVQYDTKWNGTGIGVLDLQRVGPGAAVPPGVPRVPGPGEMYVSPKVRDLLAGHAELRRRLDARVVGVIGDAGLTSPVDANVIRGAGDLRHDPRAFGVTSFGHASGRVSLGPLFNLLVVVMVAALLLPVGVFVGTAVRFGSEDRDRRLAALRLAGADRAMTARVAAGETLLGAVAGLIVGGLLFVLTRPLMEDISVSGLAVFAEDVVPSTGLAIAVAVAVPLAAVLATLLTLRGVAIEPLGVTRRVRPPRRRLLWRLVPIGLGLALLWPFVQDNAGLNHSSGQYRATAGVLLVLTGVTALLPWLVETVVGRMSRGPLPLQLAVRRLQLDGGTTGRVVGGIGVAVAGAIALQTIFSAASDQVTRATGIDAATASMYVSAQVSADRADALATALARTPGVAQSVTAYAVDGRTEHGMPHVAVASCVTLRLLTSTASCADGDVFISRAFGETSIDPGMHLRLGSTPSAPVYTVPGTARVVEPRPALDYGVPSDLFLTPAAARGLDLRGGSVASYLLFGNRADAEDQVRNTLARFDRRADAFRLDDRIEPPQLRDLRRVLFFGATAVLIMIGAALLVAAMEQLRERRSVLAVLAAFGTRRRTMAWSVLCQTALPVAMGLALAVGIGLLLGYVLLRIADASISFDWGATAALVGSGAAVVAVVTLLTLPVLYRLMRPDALRVE